jgi:anti-anti-sigma factor
VEDVGDITVVNLIDRKILDEKNLEIIESQLFSLVDESGRRQILVSFINVEYISSQGLGVLIRLQKKLQSVGGKLSLCDINPVIHEVFEITALNKFFAIFEDEENALQWFAGKLPRPISRVELLGGDIAEPTNLFEGSVRRVYVNAYERNPKARAACIKHYSARCAICEFDFGAFYGHNAAGFIHVHHLKQIAKVGKKYRVDPVKHLIPVCPNCHAVIHLGKKERSPVEVKAMVRRAKKNTIAR